MASRVDGETIQRMREDCLEDFVSIAKEIEELIISQIESEDVLVRRYMNADLKMQMLLYERGYSTRENVIRMPAATSAALPRRTCAVEVCEA